MRNFEGKKEVYRSRINFSGMTEELFRRRLDNIPGVQTGCLQAGCKKGLD